MGKSAGDNRIDRRTFLKMSSIGAVSASAFGLPAFASENKETAKSSMYRILGRTKLEVSPVGVGAMRTSEPAVLQAAFDKGVNYLDTAHCYMGGNNERYVGRALKGYREKVILATKLHLGSKESMIRSVEQSLLSLQTDYIDIIQLHGLNSADQVKNKIAQEALSVLREQGKIRFTGVTTHSKEVEVVNAVVDDKFYDVVLVVYNFKSHEPIKEAIARAAKAGVGIVAMKTQAGGYDTEELGEISPHQAALKWVLQDNNVHTTIPSMVNLSQVNEDTEVLGMKFSRTDDNIIKTYGRGIKPYYCYRCDTCLPTCPKGVEIPTLNRSLMYAEGYGDMSLARSTVNEIPAGRSLSACADCPECVAQCVNDIVISERIAKAKELFS